MTAAPLKQVSYEWDCETVSDGDTPDLENGEVLDHAHGPSFADVMQWSKRTGCEPGTRHEIVLVRDDEGGRSWAYIGNGELPKFFTTADGADGAKVPQRFHAEVARFSR